MKQNNHPYSTLNLLCNPKITDWHLNLSLRVCKVEYSYQPVNIAHYRWTWPSALQKEDQCFCDESTTKKDMQAADKSFPVFQSLPFSFLPVSWSDNSSVKSV